MFRDISLTPLVWLLVTLRASVTITIAERKLITDLSMIQDSVN